VRTAFFLNLHAFYVATVNTKHITSLGKISDSAESPRFARSRSPHLLADMHSSLFAAEKCPRKSKGFFVRKEECRNQKKRKRKSGNNHNQIIPTTLSHKNQNMQVLQPGA